MTQKELFLRIWDERPHRSEVSGEPLGAVPLAHFFAHVLPKGAYPSYKMAPDNIMLMTMAEHVLYDTGSPRGPQWEKVFAKKDELRRKYYEKNHGDILCF